MAETLTGTAYDDFSGSTLDTARWMYLEYPMPEGPAWRCAEPNARETMSEGTFTVEVERFELAHDQVQIIDNPKHLVLTTEVFPVPETGVASFAVDMAATSINGDAHDYRDGFAAFNVLDIETGWVFDVAASSNHVYAIYEMLPVPGAQAAPFTYVANNPVAPLRTDPGQTHRCEVQLDRGNNSARWLVDDALVFAVDGVRVPSGVRIGLGLFTLHPIVEGASGSLRGQGMSASWSNLSVSTGGR